MDWKFLCLNSIYSDDNLKFYNSISKEEIEELRNETGMILSGSLLELLEETNGIEDEYNYYLFPSSRMIEEYKEHLDYLIMIEADDPCKMLFFADDGCGNKFGHKYNNDGTLVTEEVGVYYPIENEFRIIAPDLKTWVTAWYSSELGT